jgi:hypothetical protein
MRLTSPNGANTIHNPNLKSQGDHKPEDGDHDNGI